jgi:hypothetical protein
MPQSLPSLRQLKATSLLFSECEYIRLLRGLPRLHLPMGELCLTYLSGNILVPFNSRFLRLKPRLYAASHVPALAEECSAVALSLFRLRTSNHAFASLPACLSALMAVDETCDCRPVLFDGGLR